MILEPLPICSARLTTIDSVNHLPVTLLTKTNKQVRQQDTHHQRAGAVETIVQHCRPLFQWMAHIFPYNELPWGGGLLPHELHF